MLSLLAAVALSVAPAPRLPDGELPAWTPIVAFDEVRIEVDTARVTGSGPYTVWLRWSFLDRASSPSSWDAGVRGSVDFVEVDCARGATRTFTSFAYRADGTPVPSASYDQPAAAWRAARAGTVAGYVAEQVCAFARARR